MIELGSLHFACFRDAQFCFAFKLNPVLQKNLNILASLSKELQYVQGRKNPLLKAERNYATTLWSINDVAVSHQGVPHYLIPCVLFAKISTEQKTKRLASSQKIYFLVKQEEIIIKNEAYRIYDNIFFSFFSALRQIHLLLFYMFQSSE